jgi:hypothetical protein
MICVAAVTPHYEYLARELHAAIDGCGTDEATLTEILATSNNKAIRGINTAYKKCKLVNQKNFKTAELYDCLPLLLRNIK